MTTLPRPPSSAIPLKTERWPGYKEAPKHRAETAAKLAPAHTFGITASSWPSRLPLLIPLALATFVNAAPAARAADPVASDAASKVGLNYPERRTQGESPIDDLNSDGRRDIVLSGHHVFDWPVLRNNGSTYMRVQALPKRGDRHGCVVADFNNDGRPDLYCNHGACEGQCTKEFPNELFLQSSTGSYSVISNLSSSSDARTTAKTWGVADPHGRGREAVALDFNKDGWPDIALANEAPSIYPTLNRLFQNLGGKFQEVIDTPIRRESGSACVEAADIDGDGWTDLLFCADEVQDRVLTYKNAGGTFQDITASTPYKGVAARQIELADVNMDGRPDLLLIEQTRFTVRLNVSGGFPTVNFSYALSQGRDLAVGDVNADGAPDIYLVQGNNSRYRDIMLINDGNGASYHTAVIPQVQVGDGEMATLVPNWNGTGQAAVLVANGRLQTLGPIQFITFSTK